MISESRTLYEAEPDVIWTMTIHRTYNSNKRGNQLESWFPEDHWEAPKYLDVWRDSKKITSFRLSRVSVKIKERIDYYVDI